MFVYSILGMSAAGRMWPWIYRLDGAPWELFCINYLLNFFLHFFPLFKHSIFWSWISVHQRDHCWPSCIAFQRTCLKYQCAILTIWGDCELSFPCLHVSFKQGGNKSEAIKVRYLEWYPAGVQQVGKGRRRRNTTNGWMNFVCRKLWQGWLYLSH